MPRRLLLLALAAASAGCSGRGAAPATPEASYRERTCYRCHGADRSGTEIGPPLRSLREHWDADALVRYIADPAPFRDADPRIRELVDRYNGRLMRGVDLPEDEARALAEWLLRE